MNLDLLTRSFFLLCLVAGALIAYLTGAPLLRGILIGGAVGVAPFILLAAVVLLIGIWSPDLPRCRCGKARSGDYQSIGPEHLPPPESVYESQCPFCGRRYGSKGDRFWEISKDGSEIPYMVKSRWGRWQVDATEPAVAASSTHNTGGWVAPGLAESQQRGLRVGVRESKGVVVLDVTAGPDVLEWGSFEHQLNKLLNGGSKSIIVHLGNVTRIYALGVAALVRAFDRARAEGAVIKLSNPSKDVRQALELTGVAATVEMYEDESKAVASFESSPEVRAR